MIAALTLAAAMACRNAVNPCAAWPRAPWSGTIGGRPASCRLATIVVDLGVPVAHLGGRCRVKRFKHRRMLDVTLKEAGSGLICRRLPQPVTPVPPVSPNTPPALPKTCCELTLSPVGFDLMHPPRQVDGTYRCPKESGAFTLMKRPGFGVTFERHE